MAFNPFEHQDVASIPTHRVVTWNQGLEAEEGRLLLPPIQRSLVWRNSQIVNYWDSLLRGYPAGLMLVHRRAGHARTFDGQTREMSAGDFQLFDGQQRLSSLLLGHGVGKLAGKLRLWVDLKEQPAPASGLRFQLRISSSGQPFGYRAPFPNEKPSFGERRKMIEMWTKDHGDGDRFDSASAFGWRGGEYIIGAGFAVPFDEVIKMVGSDDLDVAKQQLLATDPGLAENHVMDFLVALDKALKQPILFQRLDERVLAEDSEYLRFFSRLGQGGTPLSQDEMTYSIIKHHYPYVHDRMNDIMEGQAGRLASEVHLVLGATRVAKVKSAWRPDNPWEHYSRPIPALVSRLKQLPEVEEAFSALIPASGTGGLRKSLEEIRERLVYDPECNPNGLPVMLLARMPHELVDVLLLLADVPKEGDRDLLAAFALHWLLFVADSTKAADHVFSKYIKNPPQDLASALPAWVEQFEKGAIARPFPMPIQFDGLERELNHLDHGVLRDWAERFAILNVDQERPTGLAMQMLSGHPELKKRALLWLQRKQLSESYSYFDPTSDRDEDLPIDLDHRIPSSVFGFDWRTRNNRLSFEDKNNFYEFRGSVGNSLGNLGWLDASRNRSKGAGEHEADDLVSDVEPWNRLIKKPRWDLDDVATFQLLIDEQTIRLSRRLIEEGGIYRLRQGSCSG